jgi:hypothetical protein
MPPELFTSVLAATAIGDARLAACTFLKHELRAEFEPLERSPTKPCGFSEEIPGAGAPRIAHKTECPGEG